MALAYSVRLKRWSPGGGVNGTAVRSSSLSSHVYIDLYTAGSGRRTPDGGIIPARILRTISSSFSACGWMFEKSMVSIVSLRDESIPAAFAFSLWQLTQ